MLDGQATGERASGALDERVSAFYVEQREAVFRYMLLIGVGNAEAQDIAQEAFLALYKYLRGGETVENWRGWLFRAAHNLAVNRAKAAGPSKSLDEFAAPEFAGKEMDPEAQAIREQRRARLMEAIGRLSGQ